MMVSSARHRRGHSPEHPPTCHRSWRRRATALLVAMATLMCGLITSGRLARAVEPAIAGVTASGAAADGHAAAAAVDGDPATYWQSPADSSMQDYRRFLSAGSSVPPLEALKLAGVDMTSPEPVRNALKIFQETIDQFRALNA